MMELKRCPLCDCANITIDDYELYPASSLIRDRWHRRVLCLDCGVSIHRKTDEEAAEAWNLRKYGTLSVAIEAPTINEAALDKIARNEAVEEFTQTLKDRIRTEVMPKFQTEDTDHTYRIGAEICKIDIEILISKLLREFKEKRND